MDNLYSTVYNYNGECLGPYLNTTPFRSPTSGGLNGSFKIRNNTNCVLEVYIKNGEFPSTYYAKKLIQSSVYKYDGGNIINPLSMSQIRSSTFSFYIICYARYNNELILLFEDLTNRFSHIVITEDMFSKCLKDKSRRLYVDYLKKDLEKTRTYERERVKKSFDTSMDRTKSLTTNFNKRNYVDFTSSEDSKIKPCMTSLLQHKYS